MSALSDRDLIVLRRVARNPLVPSVDLDRAVLLELVNEIIQRRAREKTN